MKMTAKTSVAGAYARKAPYEYEGKSYEADIKNGDTVKITNPGSTVTGQFGEQQVFGIMTRNGEKNFTLNQSSINVLVQEYGDESSGWVGKEGKIITKKDVIAGKKVEVAYLVTKEWSLDEWGDLSKAGQPSQVGEPGEYHEEDLPM